MNLTKEQRELLAQLVTSYRDGHTSSFFVARSHDGTSVVYQDQHSFRTTADLADFRRLGTEDMIDFDEGGSDPIGKPTQKGIDFVSNLLDRAAGVEADRPSEDRLPYDYDLFVCHAFEDKVPFVNGLVDELRSIDLRVWYDDFELTMGDSLLREISRGISRSEFGVVVLSHNFFNKNWPQSELDGLVAVESGGRKVVLPIWHGITAEEIRIFSPILAGRMAVKSSDGLPSVVNNIRKAMAKEQSQQPFVAEYPSKGQALPKSPPKDPVELVKESLSRPAPRIELHDSVTQASDALCELLESEEFSPQNPPLEQKAFLGRVAAYEKACGPLMKMLGTLGRYSVGGEVNLITETIEQVGNTGKAPGIHGWVQIQTYPALLLEYAVGVTATAAKHYDLLAAALIEAELFDRGSRARRPAVRFLNASTVFTALENLRPWLATNGNKLSACSDHLHQVVGEILQPLVGRPAQYDDAFDTFEFIAGIVAMNEDDRDWAPMGRFVWRHRPDLENSPPIRTFEKGLREEDDWAFLRAGFFGGSAVKCHQAFEKYQQLISRMRY